MESPYLMISKITYLYGFYMQFVDVASLMLAFYFFKSSPR